MKEEQVSFPIDPADESLDRLLRAAQWPDDAADPLDRLLNIAEWPEAAGDLPVVLPTERRSSRLWIAAAVAAAVLLVAAATWSLRNPEAQVKPGGARAVAVDSSRVNPV